jgi:predicted amidohydrolase
MPVISVPQFPAALGGKEANLRAIERRVSKGKADLYLFPEAFLTGYVVRDEFRRLAETLDGPSVKRVSRLAKRSGACVVFGMAERSAEKRGVVYNTAAVCTPDGEVGAYRKLYLANFGPFEERTYFAPGTDAPVFETPAGRLGVTICFDIFFPELARLYALKGADIVACISASPSATRPFFEKVLVARAIENASFVAFSNHVGTQRDMVFWGGNCVIGPRGETKALGKPYKDAEVSARVEHHELELARPHRPTLKEARADVFEMLRDLA